MNPIACPHETQVTSSARTGHWDDATKAHLAECPHCRETAQVVKWLRNAAGTGEREFPLPDARQIWLKAHIQTMQVSRERALRPLVIVNLVVRASMTLALAYGIAWSWFRIQSLVPNWLPNNLRTPLPVPEWLLSASRPALLSLAALAMCMVTLLFIRLFRPVLADE